MPGYSPLKILKTTSYPAYQAYFTVQYEGQSADKCMHFLVLTVMDWAKKKISDSDEYVFPKALCMPLPTEFSGVTNEMFSSYHEYEGYTLDITSLLPMNEGIWAFYYMATTLRNLYLQPGTDIEKEFSNSTRFEIALSEGPTTHKNTKFMNLRKDEYCGREISAEPHAKKGNRDGEPKTVRAYYVFDEQTGKIVISHCNGRHLDNASTRYV